jgi:hypothetical protein
VTTSVNSSLTDLVDVTTTTATTNVTAGTAAVTSTTTVAGTTDGSLRINQSSANGTINIKGSSGSATGLLIDTAFINQSAAATLTINGTSSTGAGLAIGSGVLGSANSTSTRVVTSNLSIPLANVTTVNASNSQTVVADANNVTTTSNLANTTTTTNSTGAVTSTVTNVTNGSTETYQAPRMVFNSSVAGSTILLTGSSNGTAGVLVQGDASFSLADGSTLRLDGVTNATNAGPGVLVVGRTVTQSLLTFFSVTGGAGKKAPPAATRLLSSRSR